VLIPLVQEDDPGGIVQHQQLTNQIKIKKYNHFFIPFLLLLVNDEHSSPLNNP
jgi:hypothetical protein